MTDEKKLAQLKAEQERVNADIARRRREIMFRLWSNGAGLSQTKIASIYGCERQYVQQEIEAYEESMKVTA